MSSGPGSHKPSIIQPYIKVMRETIQTLGCKQIVDLGCGDFHVGQQILPVCQRYTDCDVSDVILRQNMETYNDPRLDFQQIDITADDLPLGDIALVRQVLQHLSNTQISAFIESLNRLKPYKYLAVTEHLPRAPNFVANTDIKTGPLIRLFVGSGVEVDKPPFALDYMSKKIVLEVEDPVKGIPAIIRTSLFQLR
jgi:hypothetical protein